MRDRLLATNRCTVTLALAILVSTSGCSSPAGSRQQPSNGNGAGAAGAAGSGTAVADTGSGSSPAGTGDSTVSGAGGGGSGVFVGTANIAGSTVATAGFDNGGLFKDAAAVVPSSPDAQSTTSSDGAASKTGDAGPPGDGHSATITFGFWGLTAVFTQKGTDVNVLIKAAQTCPAGSHTLQIHGGFSCDSAALEGPVWDGKRGDGIPPLVCDATGKGTVTYTRLGADPAANWTVADQNQKTDVSLHVILVDGRCAAFL